MESCQSIGAELAEKMSLGSVQAVASTDRSDKAVTGQQGQRQVKLVKIKGKHASRRSNRSSAGQRSAVRTQYTPKCLEIREDNQNASEELSFLTMGRVEDGLSRDSHASLHENADISFIGKLYDSECYMRRPPSRQKNAFPTHLNKSCDEDIQTNNQSSLQSGRRDMKAATEKFRSGRDGMDILMEESEASRPALKRNCFLYSSDAGTQFEMGFGQAGPARMTCFEDVQSDKQQRFENLLDRSTDGRRKASSTRFAHGSGRCTAKDLANKSRSERQDTSADCSEAHVISRETSHAHSIRQPRNTTLGARNSRTPDIYLDEVHDSEASASTLQAFAFGKLTRKPIQRRCESVSLPCGELKTSLGKDFLSLFASS